MIENKPKSFYDSNAEQLSYDILSKIINTNDYSIQRQAGLKHVFESTNKAEWAEYSVDFLILDKKGLPILAIEIDGVEHLNKSITRKHDRIKMQLFTENSVPIIRIPISQISSYSKDKYLRYYKNELQHMIISFLSKFIYRSEYPVYCIYCNKQMRYKAKNDFSGFFYVCENKNCSRSPKTISADCIPALLNSDFMKLITYTNE